MDNIIVGDRLKHIQQKNKLSLKFESFFRNYHMIWLHSAFFATFDNNGNVQYVNL